MHEFLDVLASFGVSFVKCMVRYRLAFKPYLQ